MGDKFRVRDAQTGDLPKMERTSPGPLPKLEITPPPIGRSDRGVIVPFAVNFGSGGNSAICGNFFQFFL